METGLEMILHATVRLSIYNAAYNNIIVSTIMKHHMISITIPSLVVDCGDLSSPAYGNVTLNFTLYQSLAVYRCSYGYNLIGNSSRYCQANGQWSGEEPICESKH